MGGGIGLECRARSTNGMRVHGPELNLSSIQCELERSSGACGPDAFNSISRGGTTTQLWDSTFSLAQRRRCGPARSGGARRRETHRRAAVPSRPPGMRKTQAWAPRLQIGHPLPRPLPWWPVPVRCQAAHPWQEKSQGAMMWAMPTLSSSLDTALSIELRAPGGFPHAAALEGTSEKRGRPLFSGGRQSHCLAPILQSHFVLQTAGHG